MKRHGVKATDFYMQKRKLGQSGNAINGMIRTVSTITVALLSLLSNPAAAQERPDSVGKNKLSPGDIFRFSNVWTIRLTFTPAQWEALEPKQAGGIGGIGALPGPPETFLKIEKVLQSPVASNAGCC
jgi:hypothetical protein